ncbi:hypothetical protein RRG08_003745 [Elysia crispata]|uniref:Uncharacterized protein n=1 Tax=Elysia crispata TaxID=231223 RepID=A0AAE1E5B3_9GAST|nr:hypothetical protein RRG08_003745 [Elysia crispata]
MPCRSNLKAYILATTPDIDTDHHITERCERVIKTGQFQRSVKVKVGSLLTITSPSAVSGSSRQGSFRDPTRSVSEIRQGKGRIDIDHHITERGELIIKTGQFQRSVKVKVGSILTITSPSAVSGSSRQRKAKHNKRVRFANMFGVSLVLISSELNGRLMVEQRSTGRTSGDDISYLKASKKNLFCHQMCQFWPGKLIQFSELLRYFTPLLLPNDSVSSVLQSTGLIQFYLTVSSDGRFAANSLYKTYQQILFCLALSNESGKPGSTQLKQFVVFVGFRVDWEFYTSLMILALLTIRKDR